MSDSVTEAAAATKEDSGWALKFLSDLSRRHADEWLQLCWGFIAWHREHVLKNVPTPEVERTSRESLNKLLFTARVLKTQALDPNYSDRATAERLTHSHWVLEELWQQMNNPMSEAEADAIIKQCFPDEPRA